MDLDRDAVYGRMAVVDTTNWKPGVVAAVDFGKREILVEYAHGCHWRKEEDVEEISKMKPVLKFKILREGARLPDYKHAGDAAFDFYLPHDAVVPPKTACPDGFMVPLGVAVEIPPGYFLEIFPRSSTGLKTPLRLANSAGIIDEGFRGELALILDNFDCVGYILHAGDRVAQGILRPRIEAEIRQAEELAGSERGTDGYGSTGK